MAMNQTRNNNVRSSFQLSLCTVVVLLPWTISAFSSTVIGGSPSKCPFLSTIGGTEETDEIWSRGDLFPLLVGDKINDPLFLFKDEFYDDYDYDNHYDHDHSNRELRYDHYKSGSGYKYQRHKKRAADAYSSLSDIYLCLACAVGWCVWLVSATRSNSHLFEPSVFESQESKTIYGNVLEVTLGSDPDGTGIPVYYALVDYVVESTEPDEEPLQVRKCFSTRKLLEEGFANVQVLVLLDDPTTSILMDDFLLDKNQRTQQQMEPPDMIHATIVYLVAAILIITSLVGGLHAYYKIDPEQAFWGKVSLVIGTILLYPVALLLYHFLCWIYRWLAPYVQRPGVIVHGAKRYWNKKCGATLNPLEIIGTFDGETNTSSGNNNNNDDDKKNKNNASVYSTGDPKIATKRISHNKHNHHGASKRTGALSSVMEMTHVSSSGDNDSDSIVDRKAPMFDAKARSPRYPNAGCGFGNFNVLMPTPIKDKTDNDNSNSNNEVDNNYKTDPGYDLSTVSMSSMSSGETGSTNLNKDPELQLPDMDESDYHLPPTVPLGVRPQSQGSKSFRSGRRNHPNSFNQFGTDYYHNNTSSSSSYVPPPMTSRSEVASSTATPLASNVDMVANLRAAQEKKTNETAADGNAGTTTNANKTSNKETKKASKTTETKPTAFMAQK